MTGSMIDDEIVNILNAAKPMVTEWATVNAVTIFKTSMEQRRSEDSGTHFFPARLTTAGNSKNSKNKT